MMTAMTGTTWLTDDSDDRQENLFKDGDIVVTESGQEGGAWDRGRATTKQGDLVVAILIIWFYLVFYSCFVQQQNL